MHKFHKKNDLFEKIILHLKTSDPLLFKRFRVQLLCFFKIIFFCQDQLRSRSLFFCLRLDLLKTWPKVFDLCTSLSRSPFYEKKANVRCNIICIMGKHGFCKKKTEKNCFLSSHNDFWPIKKNIFQKQYFFRSFKNLIF